MIASLSGKIIQKNEKSTVLDVNGVGYLVFLPLEFLTRVNIGDEYFLFIRTIVREDTLALYGFDTLEKQKFFDLLMTVTRIGPKMALDIIDASVYRVKQAILKKDLGFLSQISGVGRKTAERIILELHDKIERDGTMNDNIPSGEISGKYPEIIDALQKLGYQRNHVSRVLREMPNDLENDEEIIKYFLQHV